jgi:hypothetical protein
MITSIAFIVMTAEVSRYIPVKKIILFVFIFVFSPLVTAFCQPPVLAPRNLIWFNRC